MDFKSYIAKKVKNPGIFLEAAGASTNYLELPTAYQPLAETLSLIQGRGNKIRALNWFMTEGLMEASKGREKLLTLVKAEVERMTSGNIHTLNTAHGVQNVPPSKKLGGIEEMARNPYNIFGRDLDDQEITAHDLFSPEAWKRIPILSEITLDGKNIHEYYEDHFEPRLMVFDSQDTKAQKIRVNLVKLAAQAEAIGLKSFKYGGFDGYIQFVEKGDWLESHEARTAVNPNNQQGYDLRPEKKYTKDGQEVDVDDLVSQTKRGQPVYNFQGGLVSASDRRSSITILQMQSEFADIAERIKNNDPLENQNPEDVKRWRDLLELRNKIKKTEARKNSSISKSMGFPDYGHAGPVQLPIPEDLVDPESFQQLIWDGLNRPFGLKTKVSVNSWGNPSAFGPRIDDPKNPPPNLDGWHAIQGDRLFFKLNSKQKEAIYKYIFGTYANTGMVNTNFAFTKIGDSSIRDAQPKGNSKVNLTPLLDHGFENNKELLNGMRKVIAYQVKGVKPTDYMSIAKEVKIPIKDYININQDPTISKLLDHGYKWEMKKGEVHPFADLIRHLRNPDEVQSYSPTAFLRLGNSRYKVEFDTDGKLYLHVPTDSSGNPLSSHSKDVAMLAGSKKIRFGGGVKGSHLNMRPAGRKTWELLKNRLLMGVAGNLGEIDYRGNGAKKYNDLTEIPSVKKAVGMASRYFSRNKGEEALKEFDDQELAAYAVEALPLFSNDIAFQIGWINQQEIDQFINKKTRKVQWNLQQFLDDYISGESKSPKGIYALLYKYGAIEDDKEAIEQILAMHHSKLNELRANPVSGKLLIDLIWEMDPPAAAAYAENGFNFRARVMSKHIIKRMNEKYKDEKSRGTSLDAAGQKAEDGTRKSLDIASGSQFANRETDDEYDYDVVNKKPVSGKELADMHGISWPEPDQIPSRRSIAANRTPGANVPLSNPQTLPVAQSRSDLKTQSPPSADLYDDLFGDMPQQSVQQPSQASASTDLYDDLFGDLPQQTQPKTPQKPPQSPVSSDFYNDLFGESKMGRFKGYSDWITKMEMTGTDAVAIAHTPSDGAGWNWWGAPGRKGGTSISGETDTAKSDPTGKGKKRGKKRRKRK